MGKIRNISDKTYWMFQDMRGNKTNEEYLKELLCSGDPTMVIVPEKAEKIEPPKPETQPPKISKKEAKRLKLLEDLKKLEE